MCYQNCPHERYPNGIYEGCHCTLPRGATCPMEQDDITDDDQRDGDDEYGGDDLK